MLDVISKFPNKELHRAVCDETVEFAIIWDRLRGPVVVAIGQALCNLDFDYDSLRIIILRIEKLVLSGLEACHREDIPCPAPMMLNAHDYARRFPAAGFPGRDQSEAEALGRHDLPGTTNRTGQLYKPRCVPYDAITPCAVAGWGHCHLPIWMGFPNSLKMWA